MDNAVPIVNTKWNLLVTSTNSKSLGVVAVTATGVYDSLLTKQ